MIGLGTWKFTVDTPIYKGDALLYIKDDGGNYDVKCELVGMDKAGMDAVSVCEEGENTLTGIAVTNLLKGKDIPFTITFEGGAANGFLKVPFIGKLKLKDGQKVE